VEHAHNDYLTVLAEAGVLGFSAWCAALALLFLGAWRALRGFEPANRALAACVLGGLLNAALRSPLSFNPASAGLFFAAGGALLARELHASGKLRARRGFAVLLVALLFLQVPRAWSLVQHGRALRAPDAIDTRAALLACPDSPLALSLAARWLPAERNSEARALWERVLVLRPHNFEALVQAGLLAALDGDAQSARAHWEPARELAPERSSVHQNLLYLEAEFGSEQQFEAAQRASAGSVPRSWLEAAGSNARAPNRTRAQRSRMPWNSSRNCAGRASTRKAATSPTPCAATAKRCVGHPTRAVCAWSWPRPCCKAARMSTTRAPKSIAPARARETGRYFRPGPARHSWKPACWRASRRPPALA
jgi:tetratricopeptide (TPR) repeat protein